MNYVPAERLTQQEKSSEEPFSFGAALTAKGTELVRFAKKAEVVLFRQK